MHFSWLKLSLSIEENTDPAVLNREPKFRYTRDTSIGDETPEQALGFSSQETSSGWTKFDLSKVEIFRDSSGTRVDAYQEPSDRFAAL